jgi:hypothetical protein
MKTAFLAFLLCVFSWHAFTQKLTTTLQPEMEIPVSQNLVKVQNGYLSYKIKTGKPRLATMFSSINLSRMTFNVTLIK